MLRNQDRAARRPSALERLVCRRRVFEVKPLVDMNRNRAVGDMSEQFRCGPFKPSGKRCEMKQDRAGRVEGSGGKIGKLEIAGHA